MVNPNKTFIISDTHFGDPDIIRYENRPFENVEKMNLAILENWNAVIGEDDVVYHLGDLGKDIESLQKLCPILNGHKILIRGNHDRYDADYYHLRLGFEAVYDHPIILNDFIFLSHEPLYVNKNMPYANIFGHVHQSVQYQHKGKQFYCACVEVNEYKPRSLAEIMVEMHSPTPESIHKAAFMMSQEEIGSKDVLTFIYNVLTHCDLDGSEYIRELFRSGYCYYFAHMLQLAFSRGDVAWAAPFGHFVWIDEDRIPYDIDGVYTEKALKFIAEKELGEFVHDFLHVDEKVCNMSKSEIELVMRRSPGIVINKISHKSSLKDPNVNN